MESASPAVDDARSTLDAMGVGVVVLGPDLRPTFANSTALQLLELDESALRDEGLDPVHWRFYAEDGTPIPFEQTPPVLAATTGQVTRAAILGARIPERDARRWLLLTSVPEWRGEELERVVITFEDVTSRRETLRSAEALHESVIAVMSEGVVIFAADGTIQSLNDAAVRLIALPAEGLVGQSLDDAPWTLVHPDGTPMPHEENPGVITHRTGAAQRDRLLGATVGNRDTLWVTVSTAPLGDRKSEGYPFVATFTDVTSRQRAARTLANTEERLSQVLTAIPGVLYTYVQYTDGTDAFEFASSRSLEIFGASAQELVADARSAWRRVHPEDRPRMARLRDESRDTGVRWQARFRVRHKDGQTRWVHANAAPQPFEGGVRWTGVGLDITETRRLEERLAAGAQREAMGDLAAGVAHNFNNMLAAILPNIELVAEDCDPEHRPLLADARNAARSAGDLVAQLLALAPRDPATDPGTVVDLGALVDEVVGMCRRTFDPRITITGDVDVSRSLVQVRRSALQQVVLNLCMNARDALAGVGDPSLTVRLRLERRRGQPLGVVTVQDNGVGIPPSLIQRLGEPFLTTKEPGLGTGLGLATAYRTVKRARGTIEVDSEPGRGTTFTVSLPLVEGPAEPRHPTPRPRGRRIGRILLVEDEALVRRGLVRYLRRRGFTCVEAERGDTAIELLKDPAQSEPLTAVFLDLSLPGAHGTEVLAHIREHLPGLPVLVLSGHVDPSFDIRGARRVLQKPVGMEELHQAIDALIPPVEAT